MLPLIVSAVISGIMIATLKVGFEVALAPFIN